VAITTDSSWHEALSLLRCSADRVGRLDYDARALSTSAAGERIWLDCRDCAGLAPIAAKHENCRHTTSLKYRLPLGQFRVAGLWQFGGYGQNNASNGAYQVGVGGDIPNLANGVLSFDAIYSYVKDSVSTALLGGSTDINGNPIPPFLPQVLTATILDNRAVMLLARYTKWTPEVVCGLRTDSIFGAERSADRFYEYRRRLRLPGLSSIQQHEYQQYIVRCRRFC
jgi:hypothetical protein